MQKADIIQAFFFAVFFGVGTTALSISILSDELVRYYENQQLIQEASEKLEEVDLLNEDYDVLLQRMQEDPNILQRVAPAVLGTGVDEPNTVFPRVTAQQLAAARRALNTVNENTEKKEMPKWLRRCTEPPKRRALLFSGMGLILISSIFFRPIKRKEEKDY